MAGTWSFFWQLHTYGSSCGVTRIRVWGFRRQNDKAWWCQGNREEKFNLTCIPQLPECLWRVGSQAPWDKSSLHPRTAIPWKKKKKRKKIHCPKNGRRRRSARSREDRKGYTQTKGSDKSQTDYKQALTTAPAPAQRLPLCAPSTRPHISSSPYKSELSLRAPEAPATQLRSPVPFVCWHNKSFSSDSPSIQQIATKATKSSHPCAKCITRIQDLSARTHTHTHKYEELWLACEEERWTETPPPTQRVHTPYVCMYVYNCREINGMQMFGEKYIWKLCLWIWWCWEKHGFKKTHFYVSLLGEWTKQIFVSNYPSDILWFMKSKDRYCCQ